MQEISQTKKYKSIYWIFFALHILLNVGPLLVYTIIAYIESDLVSEKLTLSMTVLVVLIMTVVSIINKITFKSRIWVITIGLYFCIENILTPLIIVAVCQTVDELIVHPIMLAYKNKMTISKEIDKRL